MKQKRVQFYTAEKLLHVLSSHEVSGILKTFLESIAKIDLLIIDELGYIELNKKTAA